MFFNEGDQVMGSTGVILAVIGGFLVLLVIVVLYAVSIYNGLVTMRNRFGNAYSQIDVQLKRRYDLIPNLVETVKGVMSHERETLEAVIQARNQAVAAGKTAAADPSDAAAVQGAVAADAALSGTLGRLFALTEAYPDLKASQNMTSLQEELSSTENRIGFARQAYNDSVMQYNTAREVFPAVLFAASFGFKEGAYWQIEETAERENVKVSFN